MGIGLRGWLCSMDSWGGSRREPPSSIGAEGAGWVVSGRRVLPHAATPEPFAASTCRCPVRHAHPPWGGVVNGPCGLGHVGVAVIEQTTGHLTAIRRLRQAKPAAAIPPSGSVRDAGHIWRIQIDSVRQGSLIGVAVVEDSKTHRLRCCICSSAQTEPLATISGCSAIWYAN